MKILLHICCAPCLIYPLEQLKEKGFEVQGFFYNPNIHPLAEYENRRQAVEDLRKTTQIDVIYPEYKPQEFFQAVNLGKALLDSGLRRNDGKDEGDSGRRNDEDLVRRNDEGRVEDKPQRCSLCWALRLRQTAKIAKEKGFDYFTTTLLVSPYQDQELLKKIGSDIAETQGIDFYYEDFRPGFRRARNEAKAKGIYCQKYCGCMYSETEKLKKR